MAERYLKRNEHGTYEGAFKGKSIRMYAVSGDRMVLEFDTPGRTQFRPMVYVRRSGWVGVAAASMLLDWLDSIEYEAPVKLGRTGSGEWKWRQYPLIPQELDARQGNADYVMEGAPIPVSFPRLGHARAFLSAVKSDG